MIRWSTVLIIGLSTILMTRLSAILMVLGGSGPVHKRLVQTGPRTTQDWLGPVLVFPKNAKKLDWTGLLNTTPKQLLQLHMLAVAEKHPPDAPQCNSHIHTHSSQLFSGTPIQGQHPLHDDDPPSPPPQPLGLHQTQSFSRLPSTITKSHTIFARHTEDRVDPDEDGLVIDEVSPSEDDHFAEAIICSEGESHHWYVCESRSFRF